MKGFFDSLGHSNLHSLATSGWRWWTRELAAMVPSRLRRLTAGLRTRLVIDMTEADIVIGRQTDAQFEELHRGGGDDLESGGEKNTGGLYRDPILILPADAVLQRSLSLPLSPIRVLRQVLGYELERVSPIDPILLYSDYQIIGRDRTAKRIRVNLRMVKRATVDDALAWCRVSGVSPSAVHFGTLCNPPFKLARSKSSMLKSRLSVDRVLTLGLVGLASTLAVALLVLTLIREQGSQASLAAQAAEAHQASRAAIALQAKLEKARRGQDFLADKKGNPSTTALLNEVTHILPDGSWLFGLEFSGREVRIRGYSPAASSLIAAFDTSPLFANARFRAAQTPGPKADIERFDLSFERKGG